MFKHVLTSIVILPVLFGILAAKGRGDAADRQALSRSWSLYAALWFCWLYLMYYFRVR